jgi:predicted DnaQ family exonuclease/DinG family helicase
MPDIRIPDFIAIDFETTGLNAKTDRVMEIGAVKFLAGKPAGEFSTFVNPCAAIPQHITRLTGITGKDVEVAPVFGDVADKLLEFIGSLPLCGHQVEFDINFLNEELRRLGREKLLCQQLDSAALSRLVLTDLSGFTLGQVARSIGIDLKNAHRALDDARASGLVAARLVPKLMDIEPQVRLLMAKFAPQSLIKTLLYQSAGGRSAHSQRRPLPALPPKLAVCDKPVPINEKNVEGCFADGGSLSCHIDGYAVRPAQVQMALAVAQTLNSGGYLAAEAGTGVGKSMAYLIPAALWARENKARVFVSTYTRNVGDQLVTRDLPAVRKIVGDPFSYSVLKGRANYLCVNRWRRLLAGEHGNLSPRERMAVLPLIRWAEMTTSGDIEEQNLFNRKWFGKVWNLVSAESHGCDGRRCPFSEECFLQRARRAALGANIVVINHSLFFSEICAESSFLGKIGPIVFDEAHHIEDCGHRHLRVELDTNRVTRFLDSLDSLLKVLLKGNNEASDDNHDEVKRFKAAIRRVRKSSRVFLDNCVQWVMETYKAAPASYQFAYRDNPFDAGRGPSAFGADIVDLLDSAIDLQKSRRDRGEGNDDVSVDIQSCVERVSQFKADFQYLYAGLTDDHVFWIEGDREKGWVKLCGVPLDIGEILSAVWGVHTGAVVFTSATLSVMGSIDYFRDKAGLTSRHGGKLVFESFGKPFSSSQMFRTAVKSPMDPDSADYPRFVADAVLSLLGTFEKNVLVLFTSNAMLSAVYDMMRRDERLPRDATVLAQNLSGSRQVMLDLFKKSRRTALLGADSFWEGIDVPGGECEIVVVPRLPFLVPSHPLTQALSKRSEERDEGGSFMSYAMPEALIRFRQGAGRLIRTASDRGAFVVLDRRIVEKPYGKMFTKALDGEFVYPQNIEEMLGSLHEFFNKNQ